MVAAILKFDVKGTQVTFSAANHPETWSVVRIVWFLKMPPQQKKEKLLREYRTWSLSKRRKFDRHIKVTYGLDFMRKLKRTNLPGGSHTLRSRRGSVPKVPEVPVADFSTPGQSTERDIAPISDWEIISPASKFPDDIFSQSMGESFGGEGSCAGQSDALHQEDGTIDTPQERALSGGTDSPLVDTPGPLGTPLYVGGTHHQEVSSGSEDSPFGGMSDPLQSSPYPVGGIHHPGVQLGGTNPLTEGFLSPLGGTPPLVGSTHQPGVSSGGKNTPIESFPSRVRNTDLPGASLPVAINNSHLTQESAPTGGVVRASPVPQIQEVGASHFLSEDHQHVTMRRRKSATPKRSPRYARGVQRLGGDTMLGSMLIKAAVRVREETGGEDQSSQGEMIQQIAVNDSHKDISQEGSRSHSQLNKAMASPSPSNLFLKPLPEGDENNNLAAAQYCQISEDGEEMDQSGLDEVGVLDEGGETISYSTPLTESTRNPVCSDFSGGSGKLREPAGPSESSGDPETIPRRKTARKHTHGSALDRTFPQGRGISRSRSVNPCREELVKKSVAADKTSRLDASNEEEDLKEKVLNNSSPSLRVICPDLKSFKGVTGLNSESKGSRQGSSGKQRPRRSLNNSAKEVADTMKERIKQKLAMSPPQSEHLKKREQQEHSSGTKKGSMANAHDYSGQQSVGTEREDMANKQEYSSQQSMRTEKGSMARKQDYSGQQSIRTEREDMANKRACSGQQSMQTEKRSMARKQDYSGQQSMRTERGDMANKSVHGLQQETETEEEDMASEGDHDLHIDMGDIEMANVVEDPKGTLLQQRGGDAWATTANNTTDVAGGMAEDSICLARDPPMGKAWDGGERVKLACVVSAEDESKRNSSPAAPSPVLPERGVAQEPASGYDEEEPVDDFVAAEGTLSRELFAPGQKQDKSRRLSLWEGSLRKTPSRVKPFQIQPASSQRKTKGSKDKQDMATPKRHHPSDGHGRIPKQYKKVAIPPGSTPVPSHPPTAAGDGATSSKAMPDASKVQFDMGQLVWGHMRGLPWWPGKVVHHYAMNRHNPPPPGQLVIQWFGDLKFSVMKAEQLTKFEDFADHINQTFLKKRELYRRAMFQALKLAGRQVSKTFVTSVESHPKRGSTEEERTRYQNCLEEMVAWATAGFPPAMGLKPLPAGKMKLLDSGEITMNEFCIACGNTTSVMEEHPLFEGGLCEVCRIEFLETAYMFGSDGYQCYCCICAEGKELMLCENQGCYRSFCTTCIEFLVAPGAAKKAMSQESWVCYLCQQEDSFGRLRIQEDWPRRLQEFFSRDCNMDYAPLATWAPKPLEERRPIRVLSLFDGIGTGKYALHELGFKVEVYVASEVDAGAIKVSSLRHQGAITQVGDVREITAKKLAEWGPFDLLIGGSPCNDLSIVNPARKGIYAGTGVLFFEYYRILNLLREISAPDRPLFWFFENVVFMEHKSKMVISRFLACNPVLIDAKDLSPAHRARYFWGNLPGMDRPSAALLDSPLKLQDCLEQHCNRKAKLRAICSRPPQFAKVRTITTKGNSLRQKSELLLPVEMDGKEDNLWCTELERLFGLPDHYTDVSNLNRNDRQRLLGKCWSVPVIRHLLAPLKDYYQCE